MYLEAIRVLDLLLTMRRLDESDAMMLIVVSHEGETVSVVDNMTAEKDAVEFQHLLKVVGAKDDMSEFGR